MTTSASRSQQKGAALLLLMLVVLVSVTAILVSRLSTGEAKVRQGNAPRSAMADARRALLDYASVQQDLKPGGSPVLPCPDIDSSGTTIEGQAHTDGCGAPGVSVIGRLPWRTLATPVIRDASSECLWYVVSGAWKDAGANTVELLNPDSNGQLQLLSLEDGSVLAGVTPDDRAVAMIFAANAPLQGQTRSAPAAGDQCGQGFAADDFLDDDTSSGISNALLNGSADSVDVFAVAERYAETHNDRAAVITRADMEQAIVGRHDFDATMRALGFAVTQCVADYAANNPGGASDRRLPWPAPLSLADYRPASSYNDADNGSLSGRLADTVNDSNALTGNSSPGVLSACDSVAVPAWDTRMLGLWQNWKDHFFYAVAESHAPDSGVPTSCSNCLTVNGAGQYVAVVVFANSRLSSLGQIRDAPPLDTDTRGLPGNYLEGANAGAFPLPGGSADFSSQTMSNTFNDRLFCIDSALTVSEC